MVIRRRGKASYLLTRVYDDDFELTPEIQERLEEGRKEYREGKTVHCGTAGELHKFLETL